jgi:hypothetical protein|tara:strand:- start:228 stop:959 length:732 start_codon:yes stop_codon:yes gene_type:complete
MTIVKKITDIIDEGRWHAGRNGMCDGDAGETLERLLGIKINNDPSADTSFGEIKTSKEGSHSTTKVSLFTKEPAYSISVREDIFESYKYKKDGDYSLYSQLTCNKFNNIGLKVDVDFSEKRIYLVGQNVGRLSDNYWTFDIIRESLTKKHGKGLISVGRESRKKNGQIEHRYTSVSKFGGIDISKFINSIISGDIVVELRMRYREGSSTKWKNRGTAFRVPSSKLLDAVYDKHNVIRKYREES